MNISHFEYEHDMKSVGELKLLGKLLLSTPFMGLSICLLLSVFPYFHLFMELYQCMSLSMSFSLYFLIYGFINTSFLSLYFLICISYVEMY